MTGIGVAAAFVLYAGGCILGTYFALIFLINFLINILPIQMANAAPKEPEKLVKMIFTYMAYGYISKKLKFGKSALAETFSRALPSGSTVTKDEIWKFVSLHNGQYESIWDYLSQEKNKGWKIARREKSITVRDKKEIYPGIYDINAILICDYFGKRAAVGDGFQVKSTTYEYEIILHVEVQANFTFIKSGGRWFNFDFSPQITGTIDFFYDLNGQN